MAGGEGLAVGGRWSVVMQSSFIIHYSSFMMVMTMVHVTNHPSDQESVGHRQLALPSPMGVMGWVLSEWFSDEGMHWRKV